MVAGDHDRGDPGAAGGRHRVRGLGPRRVGHGHDAQQREPFLRRFDSAGDRVEGPLGEREDAVTVGRVPIGNLAGDGPDSLRLGPGQGCEGLHGALHGDPDVVAVLMQRRHPSPAAVERNLGDPRVVPLELAPEDAELAGEREQGTLCRVPREGPRIAVPRRSAEDGVVAGPGNAGKSRQVGVAGGIGVAHDRAGGLVAGARDLVLPDGRPDPLDEHPVLGQGAGLVRAHDVDRAQRLDRRQLAREGAALGHAVGSQGEGDGHHGRKAFGDRSHGKAHRGEEHQLEGFAACDARGEHDAAHDQRGPGQPLAEHGQPALEWRRAGGVLLEQIGDPPQRRRHAGPGDDARTPAIGDRRPLEGHVPLVGQQRIRDVR